MNEEYDEDEYFKCKKCKSICEIIINERTNKPFTICENCRIKCGSKNKKNKNEVEKEQEQEMPEWKNYLISMMIKKRLI